MGGKVVGGLAGGASQRQQQPVPAVGSIENNYHGNTNGDDVMRQQN